MQKVKLKIQNRSPALRHSRALNPRPLTGEGRVRVLLVGALILAFSQWEKGHTDAWDYAMNSQKVGCMKIL